MKRNLTLTMEDELLLRARKLALDRDTSVNELVRNYLTELVEQNSLRRAAITEVERIFQTTKARIGNTTWTREELHER